MKKLIVFVQIFTLLHFQIAFANQNIQEFVVHTGSPDQGFVDSYHKIDQDWNIDFGDYKQEVMKAFYLLRQVKTIDLLRARKSYLHLLDENKRSHELYKIPEEVDEIFLAGRRIQHIELLKTQIVNLSREDNASIQDSRLAAFNELLLMSITLSYNDRLLKFFTNDIWQNNDSYLELAATENRKLMVSPGKYAGSNYSLGPIYHSQHSKGKEVAKQKIIEKHNINEIVQTLAAQKAYILNRYNLLGVQIKYRKDNRELYQVIYHKLQNELGLPNLTREMNSNYIDFRNENVGFDIQDPMQEQLARLTKDLERPGHLERVFSVVRPEFNQGILNALEGNRIFLKELNEELDIWQNPAPFLLMSLNEKNWNLLRQYSKQFNISSEFIDIAQRQADQLVNNDHQRRQLKRKFLKYASLGISVASVAFWLTGIGGIISIGVARTIAHTGLFTAGSIFGGKVIYDFSIDSQYAKLSRYLFVSTRSSGDYHTQSDYRVIANSSYSDVVLLTVVSILFARTPIWYVATKSSQVVKSLGGGLVQVHKNQIAKLKQLSQNLPSLAWTTSFGKTARNILRTPTEKLAKFKQNTSQWFAHKGKGFRNASLNFLRRSEAIDNLIKFPHVRNTVKREVFVETLAVIAGEVMARKDKIVDEWQYALLNSLFAISVTFNIASKISGSQHIIWQKMVDKRYVDHIPQANRAVLHFKSLWKNGASLGTPVLAIGALFNAVFLLQQYIANPEEFSQDDIYQALETVFWMTFIVPTISPIKGEPIYKKLNHNVENWFVKRFGTTAGLKAAEDILVPISVANNSIGIFTLATILRARGIQSSGDDEQLGHIAEPTFYHYESIEDNIDYLFPEIN